MTPPLEASWVLILGASSGFGAACAVELARNGANILGVHLDLKSTLPMAKQVISDVEAGRPARRLLQHECSRPRQATESA